MTEPESSPKLPEHGKAGSTLVELRTHSRDLAGEMFRVIDQNRAYLGAFMPWVPGIRTIEDSAEYIRTTHSNREGGLGFDFGIFSAKDGKFIGNIGIHSIDWRSRRGEIGYWIAPEFEGQGLASEAMRVLELMCFSAGFNRIEISCDSENTRSASIPRRAGYRLEATLEEDTRKTGDVSEGFRTTLLFSKTKKRFERSNRTVDTARWTKPALLERNPLLKGLIRDLQEQEHCHTVILYGSRARGAEHDHSDYDLLGLRNYGHDCGRIQRRSGIASDGNALDIFLYPDWALEVPTDAHLHWLNGALLLDSKGFGGRFLEDLEVHSKTPPTALPPDEETALRFWYERTLKRATLDTPEARYRQLWMLFQGLEDYFTLRTERYEGPNAALARLEKESPTTYRLFTDALAHPADLQRLTRVVEHVLET